MDIVLRLKGTSTLKDVATEIAALNTYVGKLGINPATGQDWFPRPFTCNPESTNPEGFLGEGNTPPDDQGYFTVRIANYLYIDWGKLPAMPTTFYVISGKPETTGVIA
jgi:hypothetical protein